MSAFLDLPLGVIILLFAILGLLLGSFLNVVIYRLPKMMDQEQDCAIAEVLEQKIEKKELLDFAPLVSHCPQCQTSYPWQTGIAVDEKKEPQTTQKFNLLVPGSACPSCHHKIRWWENIPVISWLFLLGRCSSCHTKISFRYPFIELLTGALFGFIAWQSGASIQTVLGCFFAAMIITIAMIDWDTTWLPDSLSLSLMWAGLIAALMQWSVVSIDSALWGAVAGYLILWSVATLFKVLTGKIAMANGDFKMLAALGAWFGWELLLPILLFSCITGTITAIALKGMQSKGLREGKYIPFGPFLAAAGLLILLISPERAQDFFPFFFPFLE